MSGSSPLARGLPMKGSAIRTRGRIIPARAGFTFYPFFHTLTHVDHPRSRGVYKSNIVNMTYVTGSSPLARGLHHLQPLPRWQGRIIPARAGFTAHWRHTGISPADHPRSRGVYTSARSPPTSVLGSSPLARGLRYRPHETGEGGRIIPARAGFTPLPHFPYPHAGDHPRSRGVYA